MDFYDIIVDNSKKVTSIGPIFRTIDIQDIIIDNKAQEVIAFWDEKAQTWSDNTAKLLVGIDDEILQKYKEFQKLHPEAPVTLNMINNVASVAYRDWLKFLSSVRTPKPTFNSEVIFSDHTIERSDYATYKLPYTPNPDIDIEGFLEGMSVFYEPAELDKLMWFIGATLTGDIHDIQKFAYLYGRAGSGKGTTINIIKQIFQGPYTGQISLEKLTGKSEFASSQVRDLPVLYDPEVNLYRMTNDTPLLALTAHEPISVNRKFRDPIEISFRGFLIAASNQPVKVRNIDAGINRRLVDIYQTGGKMDSTQYAAWMDSIPSQVPGIAAYAINKYRTMGRSYFEGYVSQQMLAQTNYMHRFVKTHYDQFTDPMPLNRAYSQYEEYLASDNVDFKVTRHDFQNDFARYWDHTLQKHQTVGGVQSKFWFYGFDKSSIGEQNEDTGNAGSTISNQEQPNDFDQLFNSSFNIFESDPGLVYPAQLATSTGVPSSPWTKVTTTSTDIDQSKLHYLLVDKSIIVIDIDTHKPTDKPAMEVLRKLKDVYSLPNTFAEPSRSGSGIHLYYSYSDRIPLKSMELFPQVELKVYNGNASLRRIFTKSNGVKALTSVNYATLKPLFDAAQKEPRMIDSQLKSAISTEEEIRTLIKKALRMEIHDHTKPNMDFIAHILDEAVANDVLYNISDLETAITTFATASTNQSDTCIRIAMDLPYKNPQTDPTVFDPDEFPKAPSGHVDPQDFMFYDTEVYRNVFMLSYYKRSTMDEPKTLINPSQDELYKLFTNEALVGFNNYRYDDYILYYALMGYGPLELFSVSQQLIQEHASNKLSFKAHDVSYLDLYEIASTKQSLKKWEVDLGLPYDELDIDWNEPLAPELWDRVAAYNRNDTAVLPGLLDAIYGDYEAVELLSQLSGLPLNRTINAHTTQFIFTKKDGTHVKPDSSYTQYTDLRTIFPGYEFDKYKGSSYLGLNPSNGGYVYSNPGIYKRVVELDIKSMHPTSMKELNYFGPFTENYAALMDVKFFLSDDKLDEAKEALPILGPILDDPHTNIKAVIKAVKRALNSAYGLTSATFDNALKNPQNVDNIVAKRGALFMIQLQRKLEEAGTTVVHIKTDSIKVADPTEELIHDIQEFGKQYGYTFEFEDEYAPFTLIDKAQLIGYSNAHQSWHAIGTKFINPYTYKTLFSHEDYVLDDYARTIQSRVGKLYLGDLFIGRIGSFVASENGSILTVHKDDGGVSSPAGTLSPIKEKFINPETGRTNTRRLPYKFVPTNKADLPDIDFRFYEEFVKDLLNDIIRVSSVEDLHILLPETADKLIAQYELKDAPAKAV